MLFRFGNLLRKVDRILALRNAQSGAGAGERAPRQVPQHLCVWMCAAVSDQAPSGQPRRLGKYKAKNQTLRPKINNRQTQLFSSSAHISTVIRFEEFPNAIIIPAQRLSLRRRLNDDFVRLFEDEDLSVTRQ